MFYQLPIKQRQDAPAGFGIDTSTYILVSYVMVILGNVNESNQKIKESNNCTSYIVINSKSKIKARVGIDTSRYLFVNYSMVFFENSKNMELTNRRIAQTVS